jgi:hypothetical protein
MGVYTDLIAAAVSWDASANTVATGRVITKQIEIFRERQGDPDYPTGFAAVDEVQLIDQFSGSPSGSFTLTFDLVGYAPFTTDSISVAAQLSVWNTEILDAAQAAGVPVESGDITATGDRLFAGSATITYTGDVVGGKNHELVSIDLSNVSINPVPLGYTTQNGGGGQNELQVFPAFLPGVTGGLYNLYIFLVDPIHPNSTSPLSYDSHSSAMDSNINDAFQFYPGWNYRDIYLSFDGISLVDGDVDLEYGGSSVANKDHFQGDVQNISLSGTWDKGADVSRVEGGTPNRTALAAIKIMSLADSAPPPQGTSSGITAITTRNNNPQFPTQETLQALAYQAAIDDGSDQLYVDLMTQFGLSHLL